MTKGESDSDSNLQGVEGKSSIVNPDIPKNLKILISVFSGILIIIHMLFPQLLIDSVSVTLLIIVIFPWILPYVKKVMFPGGGGIEMQDLIPPHKYPIPPPLEETKEIEPQRAKKIKPKEFKKIPSLSPPNFNITQILQRGFKRQFPDVGFDIENPNTVPLRVKVLATVHLGKKDLEALSGHYSGERIWNLNPKSGVRGHFQIPSQAVKSKELLEVKIKVTYIDQDDKEYRLLPVGYVYMRDQNSWYFNP